MKSKARRAFEWLGASVVIAAIVAVIIGVYQIQNHEDRLRSLAEDLQKLTEKVRDLEEEKRKQEDRVSTIQCGLNREAQQLFFLRCQMKGATVIGDLTCQVPGQPAEPFEPPLPVPQDCGR